MLVAGHSTVVMAPLDSALGQKSPQGGRGSVLLHFAACLHPAPCPGWGAGSCRPLNHRLAAAKPRTQGRKTKSSSPPAPLLSLAPSSASNRRVQEFHTASSFRQMFFVKLIATVPPRCFHSHEALWGWGSARSLALWGWDRPPPYSPRPWGTAGGGGSWELLSDPCELPMLSGKH